VFKSVDVRRTVIAKVDGTAWEIDPTRVGLMERIR